MWNSACSRRPPSGKSARGYMSWISFQSNIFTCRPVVAVVIAMPPAYGAHSVDSAAVYVLLEAWQALIATRALGWASSSSTCRCSLPRSWPSTASAKKSGSSPMRWLSTCWPRWARRSIAVLLTIPRRQGGGLGHERREIEWRTAGRQIDALMLDVPAAAALRLEVEADRPPLARLDLATERGRRVIGVALSRLSERRL